MDDDGLSWSTSDFDSSGGFLGSNSGIEESTNLYEEGQDGSEGGAVPPDQGDGSYGYEYESPGYGSDGYGEAQEYTGADIDTNLSDWSDPAPTADNPYGF